MRREFIRLIGINRFFAVCRTLAFFLIFAGLIGGCSGSGSQTTTTVRGWVSAGESVSGASLAIYDVSGQQIYQSGGPATDDFGSFRISVENLPAYFKVTASGGNIAGKAFPSELSAHYENYDPETDIIYINVLTSMVSAYLDAHDGKDLAEAATIVRNALEIPQWVEIGSSLTVNERYFSDAKFILEANNNGGVSRYIDQLVTGMEGSATRSFANVSDIGGFGDAGVFIAEQLAGGAISYAGGKLLGWGLSEMGFGFGDETGPAIKAMQQQLVDISHQLDSLSSQMAQMKTELKKAIHQMGYDTRVDVDPMFSLLTSITNIKNSHTDFVSKSAVKTTDPIALATLDITRKGIMTSIEGELLGPGVDVTHYQDIIHNQLIGIASTTPLLKLWSMVVRDSHRFLSFRDSDLVQNQFDYFDAKQVWLMELLVEYMHAKQSAAEKERTKYAKDSKEYVDLSAQINTYIANVNTITDKYKKNHDAQKNLLLKPVPKLSYQGDLYLYPETGLMIVLTPDFLRDKPIAMENTIYFRQSPGGSWLDYDNWRYPTCAELSGFFAGWTGSSCWQYAQSQGFTGVVSARDYLGSNYSVNAIWATLRDGYWWTNFDLCYYETTYGSLRGIKFWSENTVNLMPVRTMASGELAQYFWSE